MDEGWDAEVGLNTEIVPLTKPYALYEGNLFQGVVKLDGEAGGNPRSGKWQKQQKQGG